MVILLVMRIICDAAVVASAGGHVPDDEASVMTATMTTITIKRMRMPKQILKTLCPKPRARPRTKP